MYTYTFLLLVAAVYITKRVLSTMTTNATFNKYTLSFNMVTGYHCITLYHSVGHPLSIYVLYQIILVQGE